MHRQTLVEQSLSLARKEYSCRELVCHYLQRIERFNGLNAFISRLDEDSACQQADQADRLRQQGLAKALTGIPMAHKDLFCTQTLPTTCGSKMLAHYVSPFAATVVNRLNEQGAIVLGKTNLDEFAMGSTNENSYFGAVPNPWDLTRVAGGSSGGSAAAVAAGLVSFATGSDTGGSIRQPAAFCGVCGIKPTYGLVSRFGMVAYASSLDQGGPLANSVEDLALILTFMAGHDPKDSTSLAKPTPNYLTTLNQPIEGLRIGIPEGFFHEALTPDIAQAIDEASTVLEQAGAKRVKLSLHLQAEWIACYYLLACAEASSNLSRYDGLRFGHRSREGHSLKEQIINTRKEGFGMEVKRRILLGTHLLSSGYFDDYYMQALKVRRLIQQELLNAFQAVDVILSPTTPTCAFKMGESRSNPIDTYLADVYTVAANLAGLPALSFPVGFSQGLPIGLQLVGKPFGESTLLRCGHFYQQQTDWHRAKPQQFR